MTFSISFTNMVLLQISNLTKNFGGLTAIDNLSLFVNQGEIAGLIGPNGAGKTTTFNLISGVLRPTNGKILYQGEDITGCRPHVLAAKGIVRTFQLVTLIKDFTVFDNILVATHLQAIPRIWGTFFKSSHYRQQLEFRSRRVLELLDFSGLGDVKNELAQNLPHGYQKRVSLAMALAARPKLLLLDEPMTGMNLEEIQTMMELIRKIREDGIAIFLVEHHMMAVMGLCDRVVVLNFGQKIIEGLPEEVSKNKEVIKAYLGAKH